MTPVMVAVSDMDWEDVKTFACVARLGSVRQAATVLGCHHSTVARRVDRLERSIGTKLFQRRPEGYSLTSPGEALLEVALPISDQMLAAERRLSGQQMRVSGTVRITMPPVVAVRAFAPRLRAFAESHPDLSLDIITTTATLDVARREADIAIRMDNNPPPSLIGKRLFTYRDTVYASPSYLSELEAGREPARWICWDTGEAFRAQARRTPWPDAPSWGRLADLDLQCAAARGGLGLALLPCFVGDADPDLVRATDAPPHKARDVWLLTHSDHKQTARIRVVMNFAETVLRDHRSAFEGTRTDKKNRDIDAALRLEGARR